MNYSLHKPEQKQEIIQLFKNTFTNSEGPEEGLLLEKLSSEFLELAGSANDLSVMVATSEQNQVIGSVIFSKLNFPNGENVYLLSPMAVATDYHGQGIGQGLIQFGLNMLKENGVESVVTYGDINFYSKVGFAPIKETIMQAPFALSYPDGWIAQSLLEDEIQPIIGKPTCAEPLNDSNYW